MSIENCMASALMKPGTLVRFNHERDGGPVHRVFGVSVDGMIELDDMGGFFAPHLFVIADDIGDIPSKVDEYAEPEDIIEAAQQLLMEQGTCECPRCGRLHHKLASKPPEAIAGPSLLKSAELLGPTSMFTELIARDLFGPRNHVWDRRWKELHENGLRFQSWSGGEPTEGKGFYRSQAQIAVDTIKRKIDTRLDLHLCDMREGYDDSIVGFNEAWNIVRAIFAEELKP